MINLTDITQSIGWKNSKKLLFGKIHDTLGGSMRLLIAGGADLIPKFQNFSEKLDLLSSRVMD